MLICIGLISGNSTFDDPGSSINSKKFHTSWIIEDILIYEYTIVILKYIIKHSNVDTKKLLTDDISPKKSNKESKLY